MKRRLARYIQTTLNSCGSGTSTCDQPPPSGFAHAIDAKQTVRDGVPDARPTSQASVEQARVSPCQVNGTGALEDPYHLAWAHRPAMKRALKTGDARAHCPSCLQDVSRQGNCCFQPPEPTNPLYDARFARL